MSVFDTPTIEQETAKTAEVQSDDTTEDWVAKVVSEKGNEKWKDPQTLAKGYAHAQARIKELEALEEKMKEQDYSKTLLEQLAARQATKEVTPTAVAEEPKSDTEISGNTSPSPEDFESLLEKTLNAREARSKVETTLRAKFGDGANAIVHQRSKELGLSIERMQELASESPDAFLRLVGEPDAKQTNTLPKGIVNTAGFNSTTGEKNQTYYTNLRRTNRKLYDSLQPQMFNDRVRLGDKFYT